MKTYRAILILSICVAIAPPAPRALAQQSGKPEKDSLARINTRAEFDRLARVYFRGRFYALPHVLFVLDRRDPRVYYVDS